MKRWIIGSLGLLLAVVIGLAAFLALNWAETTGQADPSASDVLADSTPPGRAAYLAGRAGHHGVPSYSVTLSDPTRPGVSYHGGEASDDALFQSASLSKAVAAAGILTLAAHEGVDIDADIRDHVTSVDIRALPGGDRPVSLRALLSHTAGATVSGYPGYRRGKALPDTATVITDPPRPSFVTPPVTLSGPKGDYAYSGGGYTIAQLFAEDVSGQPFDALMRDLILDPVGMDSSTFAQPVEADPDALARVVGTTSPRVIGAGIFAPLDDSWHDYPAQAAAGLWATSADYVRFARAVMDAGAGRDSSVEASVARAMLTPVSETYGLGVSLTRDADGAVTRFGHSGANSGYRALFEADLRTQRIVVSLNNSGSGGHAFNAEVVNGLIDVP